MKTKHLMAIAILLIAGSFSIDAVAQTNISALIKKCENNESVDMNVVRKKNKETNQLEREVISLTIRDNEALVKEFIAAFKADEKDAEEVMEHRRGGGEQSSIMYRFENVSYSLNTNDNGNATISELPAGDGRFKVDAAPRARVNTSPRTPNAPNAIK
jgi:hypothetical protein